MWERREYNLAGQYNEKQKDDAIKNNRRGVPPGDRPTAPAITYSDPGRIPRKRKRYPHPAGGDRLKHLIQEMSAAYPSGIRGGDSGATQHRIALQGELFPSAGANETLSPGPAPRALEASAAGQESARADVVDA